MPDRAPPLAYVFWHRASGQLADQRYEAALVAFHRRLADIAAPGFVGSGTWRVPDLPWLPGGGYEDWYVVADYAALGRLNRAAVDADHRAAHDLVAAGAGTGAGGLYALLAGDAGTGHEASRTGYAAWFAKPAGTAYDAFRQRLGPLPPGAALWQRQLVLGPAPEFCLATAGLPRLPAEVMATVVEVSPIDVGSPPG